MDCRCGFYTARPLLIENVRYGNRTYDLLTLPVNS